MPLSVQNLCLHEYFLKSYLPYRYQTLHGGSMRQGLLVTLSSLTLVKPDLMSRSQRSMVNDHENGSKWGNWQNVMIFLVIIHPKDTKPPFLGSHAFMKVISMYWPSSVRLRGQSMSPSASANNSNRLFSERVWPTVSTFVMVVACDKGYHCIPNIMTLTLTQGRGDLEEVPQNRKMEFPRRW